MMSVKSCEEEGFPFVASLAYHAGGLVKEEDISKLRSPVRFTTNFILITLIET